MTTRQPDLNEGELPFFTETTWEDEINRRYKMSRATMKEWVTLVVTKDENGFKHVFQVPGIENIFDNGIVYVEKQTENGTHREYYDVVAAESYPRDYSGLQFVLSLPGFKGGLEEVPALTGYAYLNEYDRYEEGEENHGEEDN